MDRGEIFRTPYDIAYFHHVNQNETSHNVVKTTAENCILFNTTSSKYTDSWALCSGDSNCDLEGGNVEDKFQVTIKLDSSLRPDTNKEKLRIGLNSGLTTAGVLWGKKTRLIQNESP